MKLTAYVLAAMLLAPTARAAVPPPTVAPGDTWTYRVATENSAGRHETTMVTIVRRVAPDRITATRGPTDSMMPPVEQVTGADWSRLRILDGAETVVNRPFAFPLELGKSWSVAFTNVAPNSVPSTVHTRTDYSVAAWEDVTVPAGTFHALKVTATGLWTAIPAAGAPAQASKSGRTAKTFWYVPAVKRWVKSVEDYYDAAGDRSERHEDELESYSAAP